MKLSYIIKRLEAIKESRWELEIKKVLFDQDFDDLTLYFNGEVFENDTLKFFNWLPF